MKTTDQDKSYTENLGEISTKSTSEVYIIAADSGVGELLVELLENQFNVHPFLSFMDFEKLFLNRRSTPAPDLILCDSKLQDMNGLDALKRVRKIDSTIPFVLMVNQPEKHWVAEAFQAGVTDLLEKPFESFTFIEKFRGRIIQAQSSRKRDRLRELLLTQLLLTTTKANRLVDELAQARATPPKKLRYTDPKEEEVQFEHALLNDEKILFEIDRCRTEYLSLAENL